MWRYWAPFDDDVASALGTLREEVFRSGAYYRVNPGDPPPGSIGQALELNGESGTHSILDVFSVSPYPQLGTVAPVSPDESTRLFGTDRPTREQVEANVSASDALSASRGPWSGSYLVTFEEGTPHELFFFGISGD